jgi:hypothetical protein
MALPSNPLLRTSRHEHHLPPIATNLSYRFSFSNWRINAHARGKQIHPRARQLRHIKRVALKPQQRAIVRDNIRPELDIVRRDRGEQLEEHECPREGKIDACHCCCASALQSRKWGELGEKERRQHTTPPKRPHPAHVQLFNKSHDL